MIKLSKTSKMPCPSWSIPAGGKYCPGSKDAEVCEDCYAQKGFYHMPTVQAPRKHNASDWKRDDWVKDMVAEIKGRPYFRWFDSGDMYHPKLIDKIHRVVHNTRDTKHWIPTKMWDVPGVKAAINNLHRYKNTTVRKSCKTIDKPHSLPATVGSVVFSKDVFYSDQYPTVFRCKAPEQDHKCKDCRACWDKQVQTIGYLKS
tara:strand:+ start:511 stop:1113 length:603 start_codon:yes stop_codon:yes gene_type:complete